MPTATYSRITHDGTSASESTLCDEHFQPPFISRADALADRDVDMSAGWHPSSGNDVVTCIECGYNGVTGFDPAD